MAAEDAISDTASDSDSSFELEIESASVIRPFMFEPQHGTSSEDNSDSNTARDPPEAVTSNADSDDSETTRSRLGNRDWCTCTNCQVMLSETESLCCQEMNVLGDRLDLEGRNETFLFNNKQFNYRNLLYRICTFTNTLILSYFRSFICRNATQVYNWARII